MVKRSNLAAKRARHAGDPDWRRFMPIGWHLRRWWWINWPAVVTILVLLGVVAAIWRYGR